jgi:hypothetical protein
MKKAAVLRQIAALQDLPHQGLKDRWRELYGTEPPTYNRTRLIQRLTYRIQELAYGGLSDFARTRLRELVPEDELDIASAREARKKRRRRKDGMPVIGTRLIREWQGERYEVTVVQDGFEFAGRRFRSLTAVTKAITGTHWNGPAFFGLRGKQS